MGDSGSRLIRKEESSSRAARVSAPRTFVKEFMFLGGGRLAGQAITFLSLPIVSRLYLPEHFGTAQMILSVVMVLLVFATFRYDLAIMLPKERESALAALTLCLFLSIMVSILVFGALLFFSDFCARFFKISVKPALVFFIPALLFLNGAFGALTQWLIREKTSLLLSIILVLQSLVLVGVQIGLGIVGSPDAESILLGHLVSLLIGIVLAAILVTKGYRQSLGLIDVLRKIPQIAKQYSNFPLYQTVNGFIGESSKRLLFILLGILASSQILGLYSFAHKLVFLPVVLITCSLSPIFYRMISAETDSRVIQSHALGLLELFIKFSIPAAAMLVLFGDWLVPWFLGPRWVGTYPFLVALLPAALSFLLSSWVEGIFYFHSRQRLALIMEAVYAVIAISLIAVLLYSSVAPLVCVTIYAVLLAIYNLVFLITGFVIAKLPLPPLFDCFLRSFLQVSLLVFCFLLVWRVSPGAGGFIACLLSYVIWAGRALHLSELSRPADCQVVKGS